jgi:hypothetical protein
MGRPFRPARERVLTLAGCARDAFEHALCGARAGPPLNDIGRAIERVVSSRGSSVVRELTGHDVGRTIHEAPSSGLSPLRISKSSAYVSYGNAPASSVGPKSPVGSGIRIRRALSSAMRLTSLAGETGRW